MYGYTHTHVHTHAPQYLKLEEDGEQSRLNQWQIDHRGSLLAVMLHHTIDHERNEKTACDDRDEPPLPSEGTPPAGDATDTH